MVAVMLNEKHLQRFERRAAGGTDGQTDAYRRWLLLLAATLVALYVVVPESTSYGPLPAARPVDRDRAARFP